MVHQMHNIWTMQIKNFNAVRTQLLTTQNVTISTSLYQKKSYKPTNFPENCPCYSTTRAPSRWKLKNLYTENKENSTQGEWSLTPQPSWSHTNKGIFTTFLHLYRRLNKGIPCMFRHYWQFSGIKPHYCWPNCTARKTCEVDNCNKAARQNQEENRWNGITRNYHCRR